MWREGAFQTVWEAESWGGVAGNHSVLLQSVKSRRNRKIKGGLNPRRGQMGRGCACRRHGQEGRKTCSCSPSPINGEHAHQGSLCVGPDGKYGEKGWRCLLRKIGALAMGVASSKPTGWLLLCMLACGKKISLGKRTMRSLQTLLTACPILEWFLIWKDVFPSSTLL